MKKLILMLTMFGLLFSQDKVYINGVPVSGPEKPGKLSWIIYIYLSSMNIPFYINRFGGGKLFT